MNNTEKRENSEKAKNLLIADKVTKNSIDAENTSKVIEKVNTDEVVREVEESAETLNVDEENVSQELENIEIEEAIEEDEKSVVISEPTKAMMEEMQQDESVSSSKEIISNQVMSFWKRGGMHIQNRTRCQDGAFCVGYDKSDPLYSKYVENHNKIKVVMDGCGSCEYSLIGVLIFEQEFRKRAAEIEISPDNLEDVIKEIFKKMLLFDNSIEFILDNYLFTILICFEYEDKFEVCTCGDGFILYVHDGQVFFQELEGGEKNEQGKVLPNYFAYDLDEVKGKLSNYKEGTEFELYTFEKEKFSNVGVASDGLRFCKSLDSEDKSQLFSMIYYRLPIGLERFLEKHKGLFMDDFSISI